MDPRVFALNFHNELFTTNAEKCGDDWGWLKKSGWPPLINRMGQMAWNCLRGSKPSTLASEYLPPHIVGTVVSTAW